MAERDLTFLVVRGHRFVHVKGATWRSWCRVCGAEFEQKVGVFRYAAMRCPAHKDHTVAPDDPRHPNASAWSEYFIYADEEGKTWKAPAVRAVNPFGLHAHIPVGRVPDPFLHQPSEAPKASSAPLAPRVSKIEEADADA